MFEVISSQLDEVERACNVKVLYAIESGSRSWGFASPDSDYDVRFVYARTVDDYLALNPASDVINWRLDETLDIVGWDLSKFLLLLRKSNPSAHEWIVSPIVYREDPRFAVVRDIAPDAFNPKACLHHYLGMAKSNVDHLQAEQVKLKKYLYVLRCLFSVEWILQRGSFPPQLFAELRPVVSDDALQAAIDEVLVWKTSTQESDLHARIPVLDSWIQAEFNRLTDAVAQVQPRDPVSFDVLNEAFLSIVKS